MNDVKSKKSANLSETIREITNTNSSSCPFAATTQPLELEEQIQNIEIAQCINILESINDNNLEAKRDFLNLIQKYITIDSSLLNQINHISLDLYTEDLNKIKSQNISDYYELKNSINNSCLKYHFNSEYYKDLLEIEYSLFEDVISDFNLNYIDYELRHTIFLKELKKLSPINENEINNRSSYLKDKLNIRITDTVNAELSNFGLISPHICSSNLKDKNTKKLVKFALKSIKDLNYERELTLELLKKIKNRELVSSHSYYEIEKEIFHECVSTPESELQEIKKIPSINNIEEVPTEKIKDKPLNYNEYPNKLKHNLFLPPLERVKKIINFVSSDLRRFLYSSDEGSKVHSKIKNAIKSYAHINQYEIPLLVFDDTVFGSAKLGFLITDKAFYFKESMAKPWKFNFTDVYQVFYKKDLVLINNRKVNLTLLPKSSYLDLKNALEYIILTLKDIEAISQNHQDNYTSQVDISLNQTEKNLVCSDMNNTTIIDNIDLSPEVYFDFAKIFTDLFITPTIKKYVYYFHESEAAYTKFNTAIKTYAFLKDDEIPLVLFDNTTFESSKEGFLVTNKTIYCNSILQDPLKIDLIDVLEFYVKDSALIINNLRIIISLIDISDRKDFQSSLEILIFLLKAFLINPITVNKLIVNGKITRNKATILKVFKNTME